MCFIKARSVIYETKNNMYGANIDAFDLATECLQKWANFINITDGLASYIKAIDDEFHTLKRDTIHVSNVGIRGKHFDRDYFDNNLVERLQGTIRERNKTQRGLKDEYSAFIRGHQVYYNFIRPHGSLYGLTPAEVAGVDFNLGNKKWENLLLKSVRNKKKEVMD